MNAFDVLSPGSRVVVAKYARFNTWASCDDLVQEAAVTAIEAGRAWRDGGGCGRDAWEAWKVGLVLSRFVAEQRSPVSLPDTKGAAGSRSRASWERAASAGRAPLAVQLDDGGEIESPEVARHAAESWEPIEDRLDRARALAAAVELLEARSEAARAVVLEGERPADVAERLGLSRAEVYDQAARALRILRKAMREV